MSKKSIKSDVARREQEIQMVSAIGANINQMVSTICEAAIECRRIDFEGLESSDKAEVLKAEGTTLVALVESNNEALASMWASVAPMAAQFLGHLAQARATEAQARATEAQANLLTAQIRAKEAEVKETNAQTERLKAEAARIRAEAERAARYREASRRASMMRAFGRIR